MSVLAHVTHDETIVDRIVHPFTGIDHLVAIVLVAVSGLLLLAALRGRDAATTAGTTERVRMVGLIAGSAISLAASIAMLVLV